MPINRKYFVILFFCFSLQTLSCQTTVFIEDAVEENGAAFERLFSYEPPTNIRYAQGMDILDGYFFQGYSDGTIDVLNINSGIILQTLGPLKDESNKLIHMNDLTFRKEGNHEYLIIPTNKINGKIFVYTVYQEDGLFRINEKFRTDSPQIDETKYRAATQYFSDNNTCIQVAYKRTESDGYGDVIIEQYYFDTLESGANTKNWSVEYEKLWAMQGATTIGENCFMAVGVPHGDAKIYKIDAASGTVTCYIDFRAGEDTLKEEEMQGVAFYDGSLYFSTTYGLYKVLKMN